LLAPWRGTAARRDKERISIGTAGNENDEANYLRFGNGCHAVLPKSTKLVHPLFSRLLLPLCGGVYTSFLAKPSITVCKKPFDFILSRVSGWNVDSGQRLEILAFGWDREGVEV
jgi:hypothetical protein